MIIHNLIQGTPEWHAFRAIHYTASDAAAMLGCSPYKTRDQLLKEKAFGLFPEIPFAVQKVFDDGHRFEKLARPLAEEIIGDELYPITGSLDNTALAASFDGLTLMENISFEHKTLNDELENCQSPDDLPLYHKIQVQQQFLVSGAQKCLFMASLWTEDNELVKSVHFFCYPDIELQKKITDGWEQFEKDVLNYKPEEQKVEPVGVAPEALPALRIEVTGLVQASNLVEFKEHAIAVLRGINTDLQTDEDFADAEKTVKWCHEVEKRLDAAKQHALSQTASIDELFRTIDAIKEESRRRRLDLEKQVKRQKEEIRTKLVFETKAHFLAYLKEAQNSMPEVQLAIQAEFSESIKGLKTLSSMRNALDTKLANEKISLDNLINDYREKLILFKQKTAEFNFLFNDLKQIIKKPLDDFAVTIEHRIRTYLDGEKEKQATRKQLELIAQPEPIPAPPTVMAQPELELVDQVQREWVDQAQRVTKLAEEVGLFVQEKCFGHDEVISVNRLVPILHDFLWFLRKKRLLIE